MPYKHSIFRGDVLMQNRQQTITETKIGNTTYIVTAECSENAKETLEQKLERILCRRVADEIAPTNFHASNGAN